MGFYCRISPYIILGVLLAFSIFLYANGMNLNDIFNEIFKIILRRWFYGFIRFICFIIRNITWWV